MELNDKDISLDHFRNLASKANKDNLDMIYNIMEAAANGGAYSVSIPSTIHINESQQDILEDGGFCVNEQYIDSDDIVTISWEE